MKQGQSGAVVAGVVSSLPVKMIKRGENPSRRFKESDEEREQFRKSIKQHGVLEPLLVMPPAALDGGKYLLVAGYRRYEEAKALGLSEVPVRVISGDVDPEDVNLAENLDRRNLSPMEIALNIQDLRGRKKWSGGDNTKNVAKFLRVSTAFVTQHEKLLQLNENQQKKVHDGFLAKQAAWDVADLDVSQEVKDAILTKAEKIAAEREREEEEEREKKGKKRGRPVKAARPGPAPKGLPKVPKPAKVQKKDVAKAAKEIAPAAVAKSKGLKHRSLSDFTLLLETVFLDSGVAAFEAFGKLWLGWQKGDTSDAQFGEGMEALLK